MYEGVCKNAIVLTFHSLLIIHERDREDRSGRERLKKMRRWPKKGPREQGI